MPESDFYKREHQFTSRKLASKFTGTKAITGGHYKTRAFHTNSLNTIAEREALTKLINIIDSTLERKQLILEAIEEYHDQLEGNSGSFCEQEEDFKKHYDWLQNILGQTNQSLEAALVLQQVMYGKIYTGTSMTPENMNDSTVQMIPDSCRGKKWGLALRHCATEIGAELVRKPSKYPALSNKDAVDNIGEDFLSNEINSAMGVILTVDLLSEIKCNDGNGHKNFFGPMRQNLSLMKYAKFPQLPEELVDVIDSRESAFDDLKQSLKMLESELRTSIDFAPPYIN